MHAASPDVCPCGSSLTLDKVATRRYIDNELSIVIFALGAVGMERDTRQRQAIWRCFEREHRPLSPSELWTIAQSQIPRLGMATVYRTLKSLVEEGRLVVVDVPSEPQRYELAGLGHHHHFHCRSCDRVFDVPGCGLHETPAQLPQGFKVEEHEVWLTGLCDQCKPATRTVMASQH